MAHGYCVAIIPARGGSKGIPRKNLAPIGGRPLLAHSIAAAKLARRIDRVVVSTEDPEIAAVARQEGAEVPFLRPAELALDTTPGIEPVLHAVRWLQEHEEYRSDLVVLLQPTSPLRTAEDIDTAIDMMPQWQADSIVSVCPVKSHPYWMKRIEPDGHLTDFLPAPAPVTDRQSLPEVYSLNGAIYVVRTEVLMDRRTWYTARTFPYIMSPMRSLDIDTPWDLHLADLLMADAAGGGKP